MMRITIIGFGNQAKAWSLNLRDSYFPVRLALRPDSPSFDDAVATGIETVEIGSEDFYKDKAFALITPDHTHHEFLLMHAHKFSEGSLVLYAHGFSLVKHKFQEHYPHLNHILFAPKSIGSELRKQYELKGRLGGVYSLEYLKGETISIEKWLLKLSSALGINMGPYKATCLHETQADLYSEQGLLCSLIPYAAKEMFNHLLESGIEPELAYFECWHELKLVVSAMVDKGPEGFFDLISPNALVGSEKGFKSLFTPSFTSNLRSLFKDIQDGSFDRELEEADIVSMRNEIRARWSEDPLMKTFKNMNQE